MRSRFTVRLATLAAWAVGIVLAASSASPSVAAPPEAPIGAANGAAALTMPTEESRREQLHRAKLMLGISTAQERLVAEAAYWQGETRERLFVVAPVRGTLESATELALTRAPGADATMVAINQVVVGFERGTDLAQAAAKLRAMGLRGEVREMLAPSSFVVRTRSAMEALRAADALRARADVRFAHPDGVAPIGFGGVERGTAPEIRVEQNTTNIDDSDTFDFGATTQGVPVIMTFQIFNDGDAALTIEVPMVSGDFVLQTGPSSTTIPPAGMVEFAVQMPATTAGAQAGAITFLNNDADENPFDIDLIGTVNAPGGNQEIRVTVDGNEINVSDTVNYGMTAQNVSVSKVYTIANVGGQPLIVGTVTVPSGYTLTSAPTSPVNAGQQTQFTVRLNATSQGTFAGAVSFLNNDSDENPFQFTVTGEVGEPIPDSDISVFVENEEIMSGGFVSFGSTEEGMPIAVSFAIRNTGPGDLTIGEIGVPAGFSLAQPPASVIESMAEDTATFTLDALYGGAFSGNITIESNDTDEDPFVILVAGFVQPTTPSGGIDDGEFVKQWHQENDGSEGGAPGYDVRTPGAWDVTLGSGAIVAVMDSGSQVDHPDYDDNFLGEFLNDIFDPHGTAVAGLVAAEANYSGGRGTAPEALLHFASFAVEFSEIADAMYAADAAGADVHTNSWSYIDPNFFPDVHRDAIADLAVNGRDGLGLTIMFATGNDTRPVIWRNQTATMPEVIGVGALTNEGTLSGYSNYGPWVDFVAPSSGGTRRIYTTDITGPEGYNSAQSSNGGDFTETFGGTSAATPIAAGVIALVYSVNPDLTAEQVRRIMRRTSRDVLVVDADRPFSRLVGFSDSFGYGLIDAEAAVAAALASVGNENRTWPSEVTGLEATRTGGGGVISWTNPDSEVVANEFSGAMLVRYSGSLLWKPTDGTSYTVGQTPSAGVTILARGDIATFVDTAVTTVTNTTYAVYTYNASNFYSEPVVATIFPRESNTVFFDDMEGDDPGWGFTIDGGGGGLPGGGGGGMDDEGTNEWQRGVPELDTIAMEGTYSCNGAPCNLGQILGSPIDMFELIQGYNAAFSGVNVWATDLDGVYAPDSVHRLVTPQIDLMLPQYGSFSLSWRELLEVQGGGADVGRVYIVDALSGNTIRTLINVHQSITYDWREQWFDIRNQRNRVIQVVFELTTDGTGQYQGWSIDDVRIAGTLGGGGPIPPQGPRRIILPGFQIPMELAADAGSGGDITYDGLVTLDDLSELIEMWGQTRNRSDFSFDADLDGNGRIGVGDLLLMATLVQESMQSTP